MYHYNKKKKIWTGPKHDKDISLTIYWAKFGLPNIHKPNHNDVMLTLVMKL